MDSHPQLSIQSFHASIESQWSLFLYSETILNACYMPDVNKMLERTGLDNSDVGPVFTKYTA